MMDLLLEVVLGIEPRIMVLQTIALTSWLYHLV
jgi:hypothetical protein